MKRTLVLLFAAALTAARAQAQGNVPTFFFAAHEKVESTSATSLTVADMNAGLRDLIGAEEKYFSDHGTYTTDGSALGIYPAKPDHATVQVIFSGSRGWTAMATDHAVKGKSCVVYVGFENELPGGAPKTMAAGIVATGEGVPTCDQP
jgi:hypothetical protein